MSLQRGGVGLAAVIQEVERELMAKLFSCKDGGGKP